MSEGKIFLNKCKSAEVQSHPWPHQVIQNTLSEDVFLKLKTQCEEKIKSKTDKLVHILPEQYKDFGIDFYDETLDICKNILENVKDLCKDYPKARTYPTLGVNAHISITPPLPYKFYIHQEGLEKIWSSVTYVTPAKNIGTKMYTSQNEESFVKEAEWKPNNTFIFCGEQNKTWHSYESNQDTNRITFNLFIMKWRKKCFYPIS